MKKMLISDVHGKMIQTGGGNGARGIRTGRGSLVWMGVFGWVGGWVVTGGCQRDKQLGGTCHSRASAHSEIDVVIHKKVHHSKQISFRPLSNLNSSMKIKEASSSAERDEKDKREKRDCPNYSTPPNSAQKFNV